MVDGTAGMRVMTSNRPTVLLIPGQESDLASSRCTMVHVVGSRSRYQQPRSVAAGRSVPSSIGEVFSQASRPAIGSSFPATIVHDEGAAGWASLRRGGELLPQGDYREPRDSARPGHWREQERGRLQSVSGLLKFLRSPV